MGLTDTEYQELHGTILFISWGLFGMLGFMSAYFRDFIPQWFNMHRLFMSLATMGTYVGFVMVKQAPESEYENEPKYLTFHKMAGIIMLIMIGMNFIGGVMRPNKDNKYRKYWELCHRWFGRIILLITIIGLMLTGFRNLNYEWRIRDNWQFPAYLGYIITSSIFTGILMILGEIYRKMKNEEREANESNNRGV